MADVKVVINIPEEQYVATKVLVENYNIGSSNDRAVATGIVLPEHSDEPEWEWWQSCENCEWWTNTNGKFPRPCTYCYYKDQWTPKKGGND